MTHRPSAHLCNWHCKLKCLTGNHHREPEGKCRCCRKFHCNTAHELSRSREWDHLTVGWWLRKVEQHSALELSVDDRERRLNQ